MIINLKELAFKGTTRQFNQSIDITHLIQGQLEILKAEPLDINLEASSAPNAVHVKGELSTELLLVCTKCLSHFDEPLLIPFQKVFTSLPISSEEEDNVHLITEDKVDLMPYVEEDVILALPFTTLCSESCLGLCPHCGNNLNEQPCECKLHVMDPRLEGLKKYFQE